MHPGQFVRSTWHLATGVVLLVLGIGLWTAGQGAAVAAELVDPGQGRGTELLVLGAIVALVGLVTLVVGIVRLSRNVDLAAWEAARAISERERAARVHEPAGRITTWAHPEDWDETTGNG